MAFRFRRSLTLFPGFRVNFSKSGASVSVGPRGLHYTVGPKGTRVTAGIPGTGLSWTEYSPHAKTPSLETPTSNLGLQDATPLTAIESTPAAKLNELSTSELAPILDSAQRRFRLAPAVLCGSILIFGVAFVSSHHLLIGLAALHTVIFVSVAVYLDRYRRSVKIDYQPDGIANQITTALTDSFAELKQCSHVWSIQAQGDTNDWKRNAGASKLIKRQRIYPQSKRPSCIRGSVSFPSVTIGNDELYFLPDAMLIVESKSVAAMHYKDFTITANQSRYIEDEALPGDTQIVGQTWRYVNKSGGPDRRFNSNKELPVCLYGQMIFTSPTGLNGILQLSNPNAGESFAKVTDVLRGYDTPLSQTKSVKSFRKARHWPSVLFISLFLFSELGIGSLSALAIPDMRDRLRTVLPPALILSKPSVEQPTNSRPVERNIQRDNAASRPANVTSQNAQSTVNVPMPRPRPIQ